MKSYANLLPKSFLVLAPMDDVTDTVFRRIVAECARPNLFFTEFVNVDALQSAGRTAALKRLRFTTGERPLVAQIWGKTPKNFYKTAGELVEMGFDGVDINMGCPDKAVVKNACGGGIIQFPDRAVEIIEATKQGIAGRLPLSVKTRLGFSEFDEKWLSTLLAQNLSLLSIHLRTVKEMSKVPAHWELAYRVRELRDKLSPETLLVGNGDVETRAQAEALMEKHGYDGLMLGRAVFRDPFVFAKNSPWPSFTPRQKVELYKRHVELFDETWRQGGRPIVTLNKFCKIYINDFPGAKETRAKLMDARSARELNALLSEVLEA